MKKYSFKIDNQIIIIESITERQALAQLSILHFKTIKSFGTIELLGSDFLSNAESLGIDISRYKIKDDN